MTKGISVDGSSACATLDLVTGSIASADCNAQAMYICMSACTVRSGMPLDQDQCLF
jgi:hypothetical protein